MDEVDSTLKTSGSDECLDQPDFTKLLPDEILIDAILRRLDLKTQVKAMLTCRRWAAAMPLTETPESFHVCKLPLRPSDLSGDDTAVWAERISLALNSLLPRVGSRLKTLTVCRSDKLSAATLEQIVQFCPQLKSFHFFTMFGCSEFVKVNWSELSHVEEFYIRNNGDSLEAQPEVNAKLSELIATWPLKRLVFSSRSNNSTTTPTIANDKLTNLQLDTGALSNAELAQICQSSPKIEHLRLHVGPVLTQITSICSLKNLSQLTLSGKVPNEQFVQICGEFPNLNLLDVGRCGDLCDFGRLHHLKQLKTLKVARLKSEDIDKGHWQLEEFSGPLDDAGLSTLSRKCHQLKVINLSFSKQITGQLLTNVAANCGQLESIDLSYTGISGERLLALGQCRSLRVLYVDLYRYDNHLRPSHLTQLGISRLAAGITAPPLIVRLWWYDVDTISQREFLELLAANIRVINVYHRE